MVNPVSNYKWEPNHIFTESLPPTWRTRSRPRSLNMIDLWSNNIVYTILRSNEMFWPGLMNWIWCATSNPTMYKFTILTRCDVAISIWSHEPIWSKEAILNEVYGRRKKMQRKTKTNNRVKIRYKNILLMKLIYLYTLVNIKVEKI